MNIAVMKERHVNEVTESDDYRRFEKMLEAAAPGESIVPGLADDVHDDHLLRVLVVDDHRAITDTLSSLVALWGHDVRRSYDGVTGLALAAAYRPDVLLLDILMPSVSGIEVAMQVRRQDRLKHCFIVGITGRTDATHRNWCYEAGVDLLLTKPVAPSHIQTLLMLEKEHVRQLSTNSNVRTDRRETAATY